jgi:hypothetical protein
MLAPRHHQSLETGSPFRRRLTVPNRVIGTHRLEIKVPRRYSRRFGAFQPWPNARLCGAAGFGV